MSLYKRFKESSYEAHSNSETCRTFLRALRKSTVILGRKINQQAAFWNSTVPLGAFSEPWHTRQRNHQTAKEQRDGERNVVWKQIGQAKLLDCQFVKRLLLTAWNSIMMVISVLVRVSSSTQHGLTHTAPPRATAQTRRYFIPQKALENIGQCSSAARCS